MRGRLMYHPGLEFVGLFVLLAFVALVVVGIVLIVRSSSRHAPPGAATSPFPRQGGGPLQILEERFARGEIDEDEFTRRRDVLRGT